MYIFSKQANVQMFIAYFPDLYGPNAESTLVHHTLKAILANKISSFVGDKRLPVNIFSHQMVQKQWLN